MLKTSTHTGCARYEGPFYPIHIHSQLSFLRFQSTKPATGETKQKTSSLMSLVSFLAQTRDDRLDIC